MASIYQRTNKDGSKVWRAVIRIKNYPTVSDHFDRKKAAEDWAKETETEIKKGKYDFTKNREKTVAELIDLYIQDAVIGHHKAADDTIFQLKYFKNKIGKYALTYITPEVLIAQRKVLSEPNERGKTLNPATVNRYFSTLSGAFRYACKNMRWIDENPCLNLLKLKTNPKIRRTLNQDEELRLLAACNASKSPYLYCIVLIALTTGARKSEILNLIWDAIDFDNRIAHIKDSKNGHPRKIGLVDCVIEELKKIYDQRDSIKNLVFASKTAFGIVDIKKSWNKALKSAQIENFVFHGLRHHYCSMGAKAGASGLQLRSQLGHSSASMTDHYTHLDAESTRFIGENIEKRLFKGGTYANK
ncbi:tyrosine-type recombinase/integrase [Estrella lausannensis]|uniref:Shufflon-specific DNA recombinase n=1 Tax=Estrella lausannensis TaxID=483423 RepID=A0A0H5DQB1_9BACT|nr:site-specific integrase [Estrella lausannensis]CRX38831.1 shufflon-specific DNA recombinase [Estrella lausannensis]